MHLNFLTAILLKNLKSFHFVKNIKYPCTVMEMNNTFISGGN